jgi:hypothetical protein
MYKAPQCTKTHGPVRIENPILRQGWEWLDMQPNMEKIHRVRPLPQFGPAGELPSIVMDPAAPSSNVEDMIGDCVATTQVVSYFEEGVRRTIVTQLKPVDKQGRALRLEGRTPAAMVMEGLHWQIEGAKILHEKGYPRALPQEWLDVATRTATYHRPDNVYIMQALANIINSVPCVDANNKPAIRRVVCAMNWRSWQAFTQMLNDRLSTAQVPGESISPTAVDVWSCAHGGFVVARSFADSKMVNPKNNKPVQLVNISQQGAWALDPNVICKMVVPWPDIVPAMYVEDQLTWLIDVYGASVVGRLLRDTHYAAYLPTGVLDAGRDVVLEDRKNSVLKLLPTYVAPSRPVAAAPAAPAVPASGVATGVLSMESIVGGVVDGAANIDMLALTGGQSLGAPVAQPTAQPLRPAMPTAAHSPTSVPPPPVLPRVVPATLAAPAEGDDPETAVQNQFAGLNML